MSKHNSIESLLSKFGEEFYPPKFEKSEFEFFHK